MVKTYEITSGKTEQAKLELARLNFAMADIEGGKDIEENKQFAEKQLKLLKDMGCEIREYQPPKRKETSANKKQMNIRLDAVTQALLDALVEKQKVDGVHQANKTKVIEKAVFAFAWDVLGKEKTSTLIDKNYVDELGIWRK